MIRANQLLPFINKHVRLKVLFFSRKAAHSIMQNGSFPPLNPVSCAADYYVLTLFSFSLS